MSMTDEKMFATLRAQSARAPLSVRMHITGFMAQGFVGSLDPLVLTAHARACSPCRALVRAFHATVGKWLQSL